MEYSLSAVGNVPSQPTTMRLISSFTEVDVALKRTHGRPMSRQKCLGGSIMQEWNPRLSRNTYGNDLIKGFLIFPDGLIAIEEGKAGFALRLAVGAAAAIIFGEGECRGRD